MLKRLMLPFANQRKRGQLIQQLSMHQPAAQSEQTTQLLAQEAAFNRRVAIVAFTGATAALHLSLGTPIFVLNGLGYLALLGVHFAVPDRESYRTYTRDALFGYTGVTVIGYFAMRGAAGFADPTGIASKLIELGLMSALWQDRGSAGILVADLTEVVDLTDVEVHDAEAAFAQDMSAAPLTG